MRIQKRNFNNKLPISMIILILSLLSISDSLLCQGRIDVVEKGRDYFISILSPKSCSLHPPQEGLWSIATSWKKDWPADWVHANPSRFQKINGWTVLSGTLKVDQGEWKLRDSYCEEYGMIKCVRRFEWTGRETLRNITLSVRWKVHVGNLQAFLPGIIYYGNPSGKKNRPEWVPHYQGLPGEMAIFEEHRFPMPFVCLESADPSRMFGAAIHTLPTPVKDKSLSDHWWSMGVCAYQADTELVLLSGPVTYNNQKSVVKGLQSKSMKYSNTDMDVDPGAIIEKTFYIDVYGIKSQGTAFQRSVNKSLKIFKPFYRDDLPTFHTIIESKINFARSRWLEGDNYSGFNMYDKALNSKIVMGWCGQAASCGFALQQLNGDKENAELHEMVQKSLDFLSNSPIDDQGFKISFDVRNQKWDSSDHVSMGQAMYNFALAVQAARKNRQFETGKWETFLKNSCDYAAKHILSDDWQPYSTSEAFYLAPLSIAWELFSSDKYKAAAVKGAEYYARRHLDMREPYWGGTLDAQGEDKEGAWAAFQGFLAVYQMTHENKYLDWARHACDVCLSYTVVWDIPLPPGRLADHNFKTRGWTVVSPQNQHLDVFGVFFTPELYKLGELIGDEGLKNLALVMYRSCGQLIDHLGSQGEQIQHTNFAQRGDMTNVYNLRGGYAERWTVFWITAHFLNAAARFQNMGVLLK